MIRIDPRLALWKFAAGDPTVIGWTVTIGYLLASLLLATAGMLSNRAVDQSDPTEPWWSLSALMAALGLNKQLNFQTLLLDLGREFAKSEGWYADRRLLQVAFVALIGLIACAFTYRILRRPSRSPRLVGWKIGLTIILTYCLVRAAEINHLKSSNPQTRIAHSAFWSLELFGILFMLANGIRTFVAIDRGRAAALDSSSIARDR